MSFTDVQAPANIVQEYISNLPNWRAENTKRPLVRYNKDDSQMYYDSLVEQDEPWQQQVWETQEEYSYFYCMMNNQTNKTFTNLQRYLERIDPNLATTPNILKSIATKNFWTYRIRRADDFITHQEDQLFAIQKRSGRAKRFDMYEILYDKIMEALQNLPTQGVDWKDLVPAIKLLTQALQSEFPESKNPLDRFMQQRTLMLTETINNPTAQMSDEEKFSKIIEVLQSTPGLISEPSTNRDDPRD